MKKENQNTSTPIGGEAEKKYRPTPIDHVHDYHPKSGYCGICGYHRAAIESFEQEAQQSAPKEQAGNTVERVTLKEFFEAGEAYANECFCGRCEYCRYDSSPKSPNFQAFYADWQQSQQSNPLSGVEEMAKAEYPNHPEPDDYNYPNCAIREFQRKAFIAGYNAKPPIPTEGLRIPDETPSMFAKIFDSYDCKGKNLSENIIGLMQAAYNLSNADKESKAVEVIKARIAELEDYDGAYHADVDYAINELTNILKQIQ